MTAYGRTHNDGIVRMRPAGSRTKDGEPSTGAFSVPAYIRRAVPADALFRAEWHDDGILFRFLGVSEKDIPPAEAPAWVKS